MSSAVRFTVIRGTFAPTSVVGATDRWTARTRPGCVPMWRSAKSVSPVQLRAATTNTGIAFGVPRVSQSTASSVRFPPARASMFARSVQIRQSRRSETAWEARYATASSTVPPRPEI